MAGPLKKTTGLRCHLCFATGEQPCKPNWPGLQTSDIELGQRRMVRTFDTPKAQALSADPRR
jgi:hypothetical protein